ncbi:MAG: hypothetical protein GF353_02940 [Candidatus Lokiarchaeota archaeon]|nr:hypothetical protein [Candidatus Lokiarchaeota archaeon]
MAIIVFLLVLFPFFLTNLRFATAIRLRGIFTAVGTILITISGLMIVIGVVMLFVHRPAKGIGLLLSGVILLFIAGWLVGPSSVGATAGGGTSRGYN